VKEEDHASDTELLLAARTSPEPFGVFYERHFASVLAFFRRRVRGPEEAFDLAAETFAAALAALPRFDPGPEPPQAWLFVEARHLEERGYAEIAADLHCSESVVRKRVSRGLAALRSSIGTGRHHE
jgi:DNA-directed RNA polymerase specialized sigma24 family protein